MLDGREMVSFADRLLNILRVLACHGSDALSASVYYSYFVHYVPSPFDASVFCIRLATHGHDIYGMAVVPNTPEFSTYTLWYRPTVSLVEYIKEFSTSTLWYGHTVSLGRVRGLR
ncbi:hypothetical protein BC835DRAFT_1318940 [Cytidiella melzeri]|nr:hypothetical protein BC835DRAFT_1318940 [Cytidiella melzeri]